MIIYSIRVADVVSLECGYELYLLFVGSRGERWLRSNKDCISELLIIM